MARKTKRPTRGRLAQLKVRLPEQLRRDLEYAAEYAGRSMNAEIVKRITESFHKFHKTKLIARALIGELDDEIIDEIVNLRKRFGATIKDEEGRWLSGYMEETRRHDIEREVQSDEDLRDLQRDGSPKEEKS